MPDVEGTQNILSQEIEMIPVGDLIGFPNNPRIGNVSAIAESLAANKQYKPIIVQRNSMHVIAGNHTWQAAQQLGWPTIAAVVIDVDNERANRINIVDNRTADLAEWNTKALSEILGSMPDPSVGTGFDQTVIDSLLNDITTNTVSLSSGLMDVVALAQQSSNDATEILGRVASEGYDGDYEGTYDGRQEIIASGVGDADVLATAELQIRLTANEEVAFASDNYLGIPTLRKDMLLEALPGHVDTWAGPDATQDDGTTWWLWNVGCASPTGLPFDRSIASFFTFDTNFQSWYDTPAFKVAGYVAKGGKYAVVPDFSLFTDDPRIEQMYSVYKAQWLGRFMQEAGIKVIPRIQFSDEKSWEYAFLGIPKGSPVCAISIQNIDDDADKQVIKRSVAYAVNLIEPETLLVYSGNPGRKLVEESGINCKVIYVTNYVGKRRGVVFDKKEGVAGLAGIAKRSSGE